MTAHKPGDPTTLNRLYGRAKGKPLRAGQQDLVDTLLPQIAVPTDGEVTAARLFGSDCPLHFEIGFGGGEHMAGRADMLPDHGFIGAEPFINGVAQALVQHGLPALVANQYSVLDSSATSFAQHFYWSIAQGNTVGAAAREARIAVNYSLSGELIDWAVPVVYARDPNLALCARRGDVTTVPTARVHRASRRAAGARTYRVAVWDIDDVFPALEQTLTLNVTNSPLFLKIANEAVPSGRVGTPYQYVLRASSSATWKVTGALPDGIVFYSNGDTATLSGTPTVKGDFPFKVNVSGGLLSGSDTNDLTLHID